MKTLFVGLFAAMLSVGAFASEQTAEELYAARGANVQNAFKSYEMYLGLAKTEASSDLKAEKYWKAAMAIYYVGNKAADNANKKTNHQLGYEAAAKGIALLEPKASGLNGVQKEILANSYFWYGANLGKWGEANGVASSLGRWPELQDTMKKIIALKMQHIQDFGAFRILGRAFYKLPFPLGSNKKALTYLEKAFEDTKNGHDISTHGLNVVYYCNLLIASERAADAKIILKSFVAKNPETFNLARIPETKDEQQEARELLKGL